MDCKHCREKISEYIDGRLGVTAAEEFLTHIDSCPGCKKELEEMTKAVDEARSAKQYELPPGFYARMSANLDEADAKKKAPAFNWLPVFRVTATAFALVAVTIIARQVYKQEMDSRMGSGSRSLQVAQMKQEDGSGSRAPYSPGSEADGIQVEQMKQEDSFRSRNLQVAGEASDELKETKQQVVMEEKKDADKMNLAGGAAPAKAGMSKAAPAPAAVVELSEAKSYMAADEAVPAEAGTLAGAAEPAPPQAAVKKAAAPVRLLEWQGVAGGRFEGGREIKTEKELADLLSEYPGIKSEHPGIAKFDFSTGRMLVVIFAGERPTAGYKVQIQNFDFEQGEWVVNYTVVSPPAGSMNAQVITAPYLIRSFKATEYEMEFKKH